MDKQYTILLKSDDNITKFILTKEQLNKIDYFNFIDDCMIDETTFSIELEYTTYLACVSDLIALKKINSDNYFSINYDIDHYIKHENYEMIGNYLETNKITLNELIFIKKCFLQNIVIKNPVHKHLWNIYNLGFESISKFPVIKNLDISVGVSFNEDGHPNFIRIYKKNSNELIFSYRKYIPVYDNRYSFIDINNVFGMVDASNNLLLMKYDSINPKITFLTTLKSSGKNDYGVIDNRYYFTYTTQTIELYDAIDNKNYSLQL